jgi:hypothetical protein
MQRMHKVLLTNEQRKAMYNPRFMQVNIICVRNDDASKDIDKGVLLMMRLKSW